MSEVNTQLFLHDLYELRTIGAFKTGVNRPTYSPDDMQARRWLMEKMREVELSPSIDGVGNVFGQNSVSGPVLLVGSHIESQIEAGWLDGALGVVAGLALARAGLAIDVCAFADEECHFRSYLGSRSITGDLSEEEIDTIYGRNNGISLRSALEKAGLTGLPRRRLDPSRYKGFLELHIEQGRRLENEGLQIGIVNAIAGIWKWHVVFRGQQDHAGGTTMAERRDAGAAAVQLLNGIAELFPTVSGPDSVWTTTGLDLYPNSPSGIIPGRAEIRLEFRDPDLAVLQQMEAVLLSLIERCNADGVCSASIENTLKSTPAKSADDFIERMVDAASALAPDSWRVMHSGAGHDAKVISREIPMAMMFVPSINGVSHHWTEDTSDEDLALGVRVFHEAAKRILAD